MVSTSIAFYKYRTKIASIGENSNAGIPKCGKMEDLWMSWSPADFRHESVLGQWDSPPFRRARGTNPNGGNRRCSRRHIRRIVCSCAQNCRPGNAPQSQMHSKHAHNGIPSRVSHRAPTYKLDIWFWLLTSILLKLSLAILLTPNNSGKRQQKKLQEILVSL